MGLLQSAIREALNTRRVRKACRWVFAHRHVWHEAGLALRVIPKREHKYEDTYKHGYRYE